MVYDSKEGKIEKIQKGEKGFEKCQSLPGDIGKYVCPVKGGVYEVFEFGNEEAVFQSEGLSVDEKEFGKESSEAYEKGNVKGIRLSGNLIMELVDNEKY